MKSLSFSALVILIGMLSPLDTAFADQIGFIKSGSAYSSIIFPGATATDANGISDSGRIVGTYVDVNSVVHGFVKSGETWTSLTILVLRGTWAYDVNNSGLIVGMYLDDGISGVRGSAWHAFLTDGNTYTALDYPDAYSSYAYVFHQHLSNCGWTSSY